MEFSRQVSINWAGSIMEGKGTVKAGSGAFDLPGEQAMKIAHAARSDSVITVMVWLCSSEQPVVLCGEISP